MKTKRSTFATSFYIKRSAVRNRDGKAPIMVKISIDGDDKALGTKLFVTPDLWENGKAKGKSAEATEINLEHSLLLFQTGTCEFFLYDYRPFARLQKQGLEQLQELQDRKRTRIGL